MGELVIERSTFHDTLRDIHTVSHSLKYQLQLKSSEVQKKLAFM